MSALRKLRALKDAEAKPATGGAGEAAAPAPVEEEPPRSELARASAFSAAAFGDEEDSSQAEALEATESDEEADAPVAAKKPAAKPKAKKAKPKKKESKQQAEKAAAAQAAKEDAELAAVLKEFGSPASAAESKTEFVVAESKNWGVLSMDAKAFNVENEVSVCSFFKQPPTRVDFMRR